MHHNPARSRLAALLGVAGCLTAAPFAAMAQSAPNVLERNLPPVETGGGGLRLEVPQVGEPDDAPFGVAVTGIRLIGLNAPVQTTPVGGGVDVAGAEGVAAEALNDALIPFVGQPLSRRLLADIQAAVAKTFRQGGRPFVSITAPPQDISTGVLQLRVVAFRTGAVKASGSGSEKDGGQDQALADKVRAPQGEIIDARLITEDLDWLNRYSYRQTNGVFEPGSLPGSSDLNLEVTRDKPWRAFVGWSNTGTRATDRNRYFLGFNAGIEALNDLMVSYQLTGSGNFVADPASVNLSDTHWADYVSHAARITVPTFDRQALEIAPNFVATRQTSGASLDFHSMAFELAVLYRSALSNLSEDFAGWGDVYGGVTPKWLKRQTLFDGDEQAEGGAAVFDAVLGWNRSWTRGDGGLLATDLRLVGNPGGVLPGNTDTKWSLFSNGRVAEASYGYAYGTLEQRTPLAPLGLNGLTLRSELTVQAAGQALPDTEQLSLGGYYAVRGYSLEDASADTGAVLRTELRLPVLPLAAAMGQAEDGLAPFAFVDMARGHSFSVTSDADPVLVGVGAGLEYQLARNLAVSGALGAALTNAQQSKQGDLNGQLRAIVTF